MKPFNNGPVDGYGNVGNIPLLGTHIFLGDSPTDLSGSGLIMPVTFGETVVTTQLVKPDMASGKWILAQANVASGLYPALGVVVTGGNNNDSGTVMILGRVRNDVIPVGGLKLYLSSTAPGGYTTTMPSSSGDVVQIIGITISADYALFNFNNTWVELT